MWLLAGLFLSLASVAIGERYTFTNYGLDSGLTNVNITALIGTGSGEIWAGTQKGVFRANGSRFEQQDQFTDAGIEGVWTMGEDNEGRVWAADGHHLVYAENGRVHPLPGVRLHILHVNGVQLLRVPGELDAVYLLHDSTLDRIASPDHGKTWYRSPAFAPDWAQRVPELGQLKGVGAAGEHKLWAGCGSQVCAVDLKQKAVIKFGPRQGIPAGSWTSFLVTRLGEIWARDGRTVARLGVGADHFVSLPDLPKGRPASSSSPTLLEDQEGRVVINLTEGVARFDGRAWRVWDQRNGLPEDEIDTLLFDRDGDLWLAPVGRGLSRWLGYGRWEGWTKADGLSSNVVLDTTRDRAGNLWVATDRGLNRLDSTSGQMEPVAEVPLRELTALVEHAGRLWLGDGLGRVVVFDPNSGKSRVMLEHRDTIYQMLLDKQDRLWVCSPQGLDYFASEDQWARSHHVEPPLLPTGNVYSISEGAPGVLWASTEKGIYRLDGSRWTPIELPRQGWTFARGAFYTLVPTGAPDGSLWVQTRQPSEIVHLAVQGSVTSIMSKYSDPLMEAENLGFMALDRRGWLWIESDRGVHIFDGRQWVRSNNEDGLLYDNPDYPSFLADSDGSVWIGTSGGLSHMLHPEQLFNLPAPTMELDSVRLASSSLRVGTQGEYDLRRPPLSVRLRNSEYGRAGAIVYRYRLEGQENAWQETEAGSLRFPALEPGSYILHVVAYDRRLHRSSVEHTVSFTLLEPWWNRTWFHLIEAVAAAAIALLGWRLSVRLLVMRQRELEALVAARTGELEKEKAELLGARSALIEMTRRDNLTGLLNRAAIFERLQALCEVSLATSAPLAIVMADIDHFKRINDEHGHVVGDLAIRECADRLAKTIRPVDLVGRYGGEELLILMPGLDPEASAERMEELRAAIGGEPIRKGAVELHVTCSFGVAWMGRERCALEALVAVADEALYTAKKNGRNRVEFAIREIATLEAPVVPTATRVQTHPRSLSTPVASSF